MIEKNGIVKNIFYCKCVPSEKKIEYAFYLYKNSKRIETKWYRNLSEVEFKLTEAGRYHVVAFIKEGAKEPKIYETIKISYVPIETRKNVSIFGSCVSRDILESKKFQFINLNTYTARQSIVSAVSKPLECNIGDINLASNFQKRMIESDFKKDTFDKFRRDKSKYLIIDLIDERFQLAKYNNSIVTFSNELMISAYIEKPKFINKGRLMKRKSFNLFKRKHMVLKSYMDEFIERILSIYKQENVILHRAIMLDHYKNTSGDIVQFSQNYVDNNKEVNAKLNYMYDYLIDKMPNCNVIDICSQYNADESNKWGLAPMHYESEYYEMVNKILYTLLEGDNNEC